MLAIFDDDDHATRLLIQSLRTAGIAVTTLVVRYHGSLPDGALCPFTAYTGIEPRGTPLFFDEVPVPAWCEIRQGREPYGEILRDGAVLGRIHYDANSFREVESVEWLLPDGASAHTDHYDRHGHHYATTYYSEGVAYQTVYRGPAQTEIEIHHVSRVVTLRSRHSIRTFATLAEFVAHFIDDVGLADDRVLINSLSYPLFVMRRRAAVPNTTLFWQEEMPGDVPGNMATELAEPRALERVVFCEEAVREKVAAAYPRTEVELAYLSPLGQFASKGEYDTRRVFTLTHTDKLPGLVDLLEAFPEVTFSVAALTLMSDKLHDLARRYPNLALIPTANHTRIGEELDRASIYLDINAGAQVLDVVTAAYYLDLVVLATAEAAKDPGRARVCATMAELRACLARAIASPEDRARVLDDLHRQHGPQSTAEDYRHLLALPGDRQSG